MQNNSSPFVQTLKLYVYWAWLEIASIFTPKKKNDVKAHKAALLSFRLPPQFDSGTHRALSFLRYAEDCNWNVFGITNHNSQNEPSKAGMELLDLIDRDIKIYEAKKLFTGSSWSITPKLDGDISTALSLVKIGLEIFKHEKPDVIVASSPPFCFAIAGLFLSKLTGLPLVLDYRDEWTLCPFHFVSKTKLDKWFERRCINRADLIAYTTKSHLKSHQIAFSIVESKQALVYNGWDDSQPQSIAQQKVNPTNSLVISYIGRLSAHVDLAEFIAFFEQTFAEYFSTDKKITLRFIGPKIKIYEDYLHDLIAQKNTAITIESVGLVKKSEALKLMDSSDYLLMMCNEELATYIPGKIYDYLSRKVPILAYGYPGEVSEILQQTHSGHFVNQGDTKAMFNALNMAPIDLTSNPRLDEFLLERTRKEQAKKLFELLSNLEVQKSSRDHQ